MNERQYPPPPPRTSTCSRPASTCSSPKPGRRGPPAGTRRPDRPLSARPELLRAAGLQQRQSRRGAPRRGRAARPVRRTVARDRAVRLVRRHDPAPLAGAVRRRSRPRRQGACDCGTHLRTHRIPRTRARRAARCTRRAGRRRRARGAAHVVRGPPRDGHTRARCRARRRAAGRDAHRTRTGIRMLRLRRHVLAEASRHLRRDGARQGRVGLRDGLRPARVRRLRLPAEHRPRGRPIRRRCPSSTSPASCGGARPAPQRCAETSHERARRHPPAAARRRPVSPPRPPPRSTLASTRITTRAACKPKRHTIRTHRPSRCRPRSPRRTRTSGARPATHGPRSSPRGSPRPACAGCCSTRPAPNRGARPRAARHGRAGAVRPADRRMEDRTVRHDRRGLHRCALGHRGHRHRRARTRCRHAAHGVAGAAAACRARPCEHAAPRPARGRARGALARRHADQPRAGISPSKTSDIQQTLAYGAHGPRRLWVVIVTETAAAGPAATASEDRPQ